MGDSGHVRELRIDCCEVGEGLPPEPWSRPLRVGTVEFSAAATNRPGPPLRLVLHAWQAEAMAVELMEMAFALRPSSPRKRWWRRHG